MLSEDYDVKGGRVVTRVKDREERLREVGCPKCGTSVGSDYKEDANGISFNCPKCGKQYIPAKWKDSKTKDVANIHSDMYQRGYDNMAVAFAYIPDFKTPQEKEDYEAGAKAGLAERNKTKDSEKRWQANRDSKTKDMSRVNDQIYKGFNIYKSDKGNFYQARNDEGQIYEGTMEDIKSKIDKVWEKKDAEEVLKTETKDDSIALIGKHNDIPDANFDSAELAMGIEDEMEHTDNIDVARAIAKDHLVKDPHYYSNQAKTEDADTKADIKMMKEYSKTGDASVPTYHFEGKKEDWEALVKQSFPQAVIGPDNNGFRAVVGGFPGGEEVGSIGQIKPGIYRGGYRKELQGAFGK